MKKSEFLKELSPTYITLIYLLVASLWIIYSDKFLESLVQDQYMLNSLQTLKGLFYVVMTGLMLYYLVKKLSNNLKKSKNELLRERNYLQKITESSPVAILFVDTSGIVTFINKPALSIINLKKEDVINKKLTENDWKAFDINGEENKDMKSIFRQVSTSKKELLNQRYKLVLADGTEKLISTNAAPVYNVNDELEGVIYSVTDLTSVIQAENKLREQEERYRLLVNESPFGIAIHQHGKLIFVNPSGCKLMEAEREEDLLGKSIIELIDKDSQEEARKSEQRILQGKPVKYPIEQRYITLKGNIVEVEVVATAFTYNNEEAIQIIATDISERKTKEQILQETLNEKEILLAEMHHRVKNNMAIISGLIQLQAFASKNEEINDILYDAVRRIQAIAMIHEQLYHSNDLRNIRFDHHIENILSAIERQFQNKGIIKDLHLEDVSVNVNQAVPLALFLNEAITNVYRHAYKNGNGGKLNIRFSVIDNQITLSIKDNGQGFDKTKKINPKTTLGIQLLELTASQLHGKMKIESNGGILVHLEFDSEKKMKGSAASTND